jgi:hypothetical protein
MRLKDTLPLVLAGALASSPAMAQESEELDTTQFTPLISFVTGVPAGAMPISNELSLAADMHGMLGLGTAHGGVNLGPRINQTELKLAGIHLHCEDGNPCEFNYSMEFFHVIDDEWAFGAAMGIGFRGEGFVDARLPIAYKGFAVIPSLHKEDAELHPGLELSAVWQVGDAVSIGPTAFLSNERIGLGATFWFGPETHP